MGFMWEESTSVVFSRGGNFRACSTVDLWSILSGGDDSNEEMVTRLLQDAMDTDGSEKKSGLIPSRVQHSSR